MGLFGNMDRSKIEIDLNGTYLCEWSIETFVRKDDELADNVKLTWTVADDSTDAYGIERQEWFRAYPRYDEETYEALPASSDDNKVVTKAQIRDQLEKLKARLLSLGISEDEIDADDFDPEDYEGMADVLFRTSVDNNGRKWVNVNKITPVKPEESANLGVTSDEDGPLF